MLIRLLPDRRFLCTLQGGSEIREGGGRGIRTPEAFPPQRVPRPPQIRPQMGSIYPLPSDPPQLPIWGGRPARVGFQGRRRYLLGGFGSRCPRPRGRWTVVCRHGIGLRAHRSVRKECDRRSRGARSSGRGGRRSNWSRIRHLGSPPGPLAWRAKRRSILRFRASGLVLV
jgi:hypothetical protein